LSKPLIQLLDPVQLGTPVPPSLTGRRNYHSVAKRKNSSVVELRGAGRRHTMKMPICIFPGRRTFVSDITELRTRCRDRVQHSVHARHAPPQAKDYHTITRIHIVSARFGALTETEMEHIPYQGLSIFIQN